MSPLDPRPPSPTDDGRHPHDGLAAYALDAVDGSERDAIEAHLAACSSCRQELADHEEILSLMIRDESPPPAVWEGISQATSGRGAVGGAIGVAPVADDAPRHLRASEPGGPRRRRVLVAVLAAAAAVVVAAGIGPGLWDGSGDDDPAPETAAPDLPVGDIEAPDGTPVARVGADDEGSFVELLDPVAALPADRTYQMWSLDGPTPESLGLLGTGAEPVARITLPEGTTSVAISDEPAGGSPAPTGLIAGSGELDLPA